MATWIKPENSHHWFKLLKIHLQALWALVLEYYNICDISTPNVLI